MNSAQGVLSTSVRWTVLPVSMALQAQFPVHFAAMASSHLTSFPVRGPFPRRLPEQASRLHSALARVRFLSPQPWRLRSAGPACLTAQGSPHSVPRSAAWAARGSLQWSSNRASAWEHLTQVLPSCPARWTGTWGATLLGAQGPAWDVQPLKLRAGSHGLQRLISAWPQEEVVTSENSLGLDQLYVHEHAFVPTKTYIFFCSYIWWWFNFFFFPFHFPCKVILIENPSVTG